MYQRAQQTNNRPAQTYRGVALALAIGLAALPSVMAQTPPADAPPPGEHAGPPPGHEPPQSAYDDCRGKKEGEAVQHQTPEGKVEAFCVASPKGLFARPVKPPPRP